MCKWQDQNSLCPRQVPDPSILPTAFPQGAEKRPHKCLASPLSAYSEGLASIII